MANTNGTNALDYANKVLAMMESNRPRLKLMSAISNIMIVVNAALIIIGIMVLWGAIR